VSASPVDDVLSVAPPALSGDEAAALARDLFGVVGDVHEVASERDQTFLIDGDRPAVMKVSNAAEDPTRLDMEALAAQHAVRVDPGLPVAQPWMVPGAPGGSDDPASYRAAIPAGTGAHHVRMYDRLPGGASVRGAALGDDAVRDWATVAARLGRALRGFTHPAAHRVMLWDPQHALRLRDHLGAVRDRRVRGLVERTLDRYATVVTPLWPALRAQVIHTDLCSGNVLVDESGSVTGIVDFGDMSFSALVVDLASVVESHLAGRAVDDIVRTTRITIDGYERVTPLEPGELQILGELVAARACAGVVVPAARAALYADGDALMADLRSEAVILLEALHDIGFDQFAERIGGHARGRGASVAGLAARRRSALGPALTGLSYREPLHLVRGEGVWLFDADGRRYLDAYNNVPVLGHGHPRVVEAMARQARRLNTNLRYLHETVLEVAERLVESTGPGLDTVLFVNSGSEANDLAWRIARAATGATGGLCTAHAYHGISDAIAALSPEAWAPGERPGHIRTWPPPDVYRGAAAGTTLFAGAIGQLVEAGHAPAAAILDGILTSDGILDLDPEFAREVVRLAHEAGALWIADEVQGGHGRTGSHLWSYRRLGIEPDIVTLGKPMGNGHPVAAVITRSDLAERFAASTDFFSTFGGNPVAMAAARAVLDAIEDERILDNARTTGDELRAGLRELGASFGRIGDVRGMGLATGVEIVRPGTTIADREAADLIVNGLRDRGVLIGTTAAAGNVLKIRPPLVFGRRHADLLVARLGDVLEQLEPELDAETAPLDHGRG